MPPALCLPPSVLDHTFPADQATLVRVGRSLGYLQEDVASDKCLILITPAMTLFVEEFEWQGVASYPLLQVVHSLLVQWLLQPTKHVRVVHTGDVVIFDLHPVPLGTANGLLVDLWQEETGKLFALSCSGCGTPQCIGVACDNAYAGGSLGSYLEPSSASRFPLVGRDELPSLADFEVWTIPPDLHSRSVSYSDAKKNLYLLGGDISSTAVGSHFKVTFTGASRSWPLDYNLDPIPERFLAELVPLARMPFEVIKYVLIFGRFPEKRDHI